MSATIIVHILVCALLSSVQELPLASDAVVGALETSKAEKGQMLHVKFLLKCMQWLCSANGRYMFLFSTRFLVIFFCIIMFVVLSKRWKPGWW